MRETQTRFNNIRLEPLCSFRPAFDWHRLTQRPHPSTEIGWMWRSIQCHVQQTTAWYGLQDMLRGGVKALFKFHQTYSLTHIHTIFKSVLNQSSSIMLIIGVESVRAHLVHLRIQENLTLKQTSALVLVWNTVSLFSESLIQQLAANQNVPGLPAETAQQHLWAVTRPDRSGLCDGFQTDWRQWGQWENGTWRLPPPSGPELHKCVCVRVTLQQWFELRRFC